MVDSLNGDAAQITIVDGERQRPGLGRRRSDQRHAIDRGLRRPDDRYVLRRDHRRAGLQYSLVVTRGADFSIQPHNSLLHG